LKRVKRRYLALQLDSERVLSRRELLDAVWGAVTRLFGEYGASLTGLALIDYDEERKTAVLRTSLETLRAVRASLATITSVAGSETVVHVLAVSGTIKALHKRTLKRP
jgi:ribonuclease P/MRP protein subunit POP5